MSNSFYITTAIDYPNGKPHIGHMYEKIVADFYASYARWKGEDTFFLTGTDENGQKLLDAAQKSGYTSTQTFVDENADIFKKLCKDIKLSHSDFIRTTEPRHHDTAKWFWATMKKSEDIYFGRYSGWYCLSCEAFYPESQITEEKTCPHHGKPLEFQEEDGYFFKMSTFQEWIINHIESNPDFIFPEGARKEILSRLKGDGLKDISVSRPASGWGIEVPDDSKHVMYTWFDALINYYAAVNTDERKHYWPANKHIIGKDIAWFHTVIWPCMLKAVGLDLPKQVCVHGMVLGADGKKMSKSLGNTVEPDDVIRYFPVDSIRYYILRWIPHGGDGKFSIEEMLERHNQDLANNFGNLAMRVMKLTQKRIGDSVTTQGHSSLWNFTELQSEVDALVASCEHHKALETIWLTIQKINIHLNEHEPWRIKDDDTLFAYHMINCLHAIDCISQLLTPFLPDTAQALKTMMGQSHESLNLCFDGKTYTFGELNPLFPKIELPKPEE